ncbi:fucosyltransferase 12 [Perilla frutescens var. hirtella]|nr:fucosyltransferase 12 [Perilla frutescens var. hirtella]
MEGSPGFEAQRRHPPPVPADTDCNHHLTRSDSDASSLTAENCKYVFRRSENVSQAESTTWTNEKHNSYLYHLEMSFVEQLYQSKFVLAQCSGKNLRDKNISRKQLINLNKSSEQNGCLQQINCVPDESTPSSTSADSNASLESKKTYLYKHRGMHCHPSPAKVPTLLKLFSTKKQGKGMTSHGIRTCPHEFSSSNRYNGDSIDLTRANKKKWSNFLPILVGLVVIGEIAFLGRLDMVKNVDLVNSWADSFYHFTRTASSYRIPEAAGSDPERVVEHADNCEAWLEKEDSVPYSRDFNKDPILVNGGEEEWRTCAVGCKFGYEQGKNPDAGFGTPQQPGTATVLRSMESASYYAENDISKARRRGYDVVMTTSLSSDVPVGYFSWAEYDIMAPVQPKTESAIAAAFISNCGARNFRLQALIGLENANIKIDSYGGCHRNRDGKVDKVEALKRYKFSLAFENSNEEDYVTEKFFQSLVAGTIPVVIGAPNIQDFAPVPGSILHIKELTDVDYVAKTMKYLADNASAFNESLRWKYEGPSDSFKALVDMAAVHSSCRLCIFLATKIQSKDEKGPQFQKRPCKCTSGSKTTYHVYVRERGRFGMESIFLRSDNLTLEALSHAAVQKFRSLKHVPIWKNERPESIRGGNELKIHKMYPVGLTERQALYTFKFNGDSDFRNHIESHPCAKFEVIFV